MKRLVCRIGALTTVVVLGLIAYAYAQRGVGERYSSANPSAEEASPLRGGESQTQSPNYAVNPLRDNTLRAGPVVPAQQERNIVSDSRIKKVAAEAPLIEPVAEPAAEYNTPANSISQKSLPIAQAAPQALPSDTVPDASALDPPPMNNDADQSRYPKIVGPNLNGPPTAAVRPNRGDYQGNTNNSQSKQNQSAPPMVGRYPSRGNQEYRSADPPAVASTQSSAGQEPEPFKADPFSEPTALPQASDKGQSRNFGTVNKNLTVENYANNEGTGQPGSKQIEGAQSPQVTIQKFAPNEIQVGKPAVFRVTIRNTGPIPAGQVEIRDQVPRGTKLVGTTPKASQAARGEIVWILGTLRPGEESSVEMEVMPTAEGEIGSVATVHFGADATARTISTRPKLAVEMTSPEKVLIGEQVMLSITVTNPGTGVATGVVLEEHLPPEVQHPAGADLEYPVGDLRPGESKKLDLPLAAVAPGIARNVLTARADGNLHAEKQLEFKVVAPKLDLAMEGPKRRFLEREAVYQVSLSNPGTASAQQVELVAYLPPGLKFVSANNAGHYDDTNRAVHWRLEELPCNETGSVELVTMPVEAGQHNIKLRGTAERGLSVEKEQPVLVEGIASIVFQPVDVTGPIEVGGETTYEVHVVNQGSKAANNVRLAVLLPPELKPVAAEGPTRHAIESNRILFEGLARLPPKADTNYRVRVKGISPGDLRTRFQLVTDEMKSPVTKEENTRVYTDE
jgi:uncharacterized repeat protein (TIGR01451 family)